MRSKTKKQTDGYIGLAVLALFTVAIIAGQARGEIDPAYMFDADLPTALELGVLVERDAPAGADAAYEAIRKFRVTPNVVDFGVDILNLSELAVSGNLSSRPNRHETTF